MFEINSLHRITDKVSDRTKQFRIPKIIKKNSQTQAIKSKEKKALNRRKNSYLCRFTEAVYPPF